MFSTFMIVLPIFTLILAGWLARRMGVFGVHATTELNRFVVYLALPTLLFDIIVHVRWTDLWQPGFIAVFGLACLATFALTVAIRLRRRRHLADAAIDGLNAGYANTGFMGFPLAFVALGKDAMAPTTVAAIITVCILFAIAIVLIEVGLQTEKRRMHLAIKVVRSLARNPLLASPTIAVLFHLTGWNIPDPAENFLKLLGGAASPCALVTLGLFLAEKRETSGNDPISTALLVGSKLVLQPMVAWILAVAVFNLSPFLTHTAVLLSALPTGTGPFMLAEFYRREAQVTSRVILASTVLSILSVSAYLAIAR